MVKIKRKKRIYSKRGGAGDSSLLYASLQKKRKYYLLFSGTILFILFLTVGAYLAKGYITKALQSKFDRGLTAYQAAKGKDKGDYEEALNAFQTVSQSYGGGNLKPLSNFYMGNIHYRQEDYEKALKNYDRASKKFKDDYLWALTLYNMGKTYEASGRLKEAVDVFDRIYNDPSGLYLRPILSLEIGMLYERVGEIGKAMEQYKKVTEENTESGMKDWVIEKMDRLNDRLE